MHMFLFIVNLAMLAIDLACLNWAMQRGFRLFAILFLVGSISTIFILAGNV